MNGTRRWRFAYAGDHCFPQYLGVALTLIALWCWLGGCSDDDDTSNVAGTGAGAAVTPFGADDLPTLLQEATQRDLPSTDEDGAMQQGRERFVGLWRTQENLQEVFWGDLTWVVGHERAWHAVLVYADEARTVPVVRWDIVRRYELERLVPGSDDTYEMTWRDEFAQITAFIDQPEVFRMAGINCELTPGVTLDLSGDNNCAAPRFPFRTCPMLDYVRVDRAGVVTFGEPFEGDRCEARPTRDEGWSFAEEPLTDALRSLLLPPPSGGD